jgi:CheY-like chemotaxis protein
VPGWTIHEAANGEAAVQMVADDVDKFDVIFIDQYMASVEKQMLGTETVRELRRRGVTCCICGLSANDTEREFLTSGADFFMFKPLPFEKELLEKELSHLLWSPRHQWKKPSSGLIRMPGSGLASGAGLFARALSGAGAALIRIPSVNSTLISSTAGSMTLPPRGIGSSCEIPGDGGEKEETTPSHQVVDLQQEAPPIHQPEHDAVLSHQATDPKQEAPPSHGATLAHQDEDPKQAATPTQSVHDATLADQASDSKQVAPPIHTVHDATQLPEAAYPNHEAAPQQRVHDATVEHQTADSKQEVHPTPPVHRGDLTSQTANPGQKVPLSQPLNHADPLLQVGERKQKSPPTQHLQRVTASSTVEGLPAKFSVLFVDDDLVLRKLFMRSLKRAVPHWNIAEAPHGEAAIELIGDDVDKFGLIFMDQYMAGVEKHMLGSETVEILRHRGVTCCICGLSANNKENEFLKAGADFFILKPFPFEKELLKNELARLVYSHQKRLLSKASSAAATGSDSTSQTSPATATDDDIPCSVIVEELNVSRLCTTSEDA